MSKAKKPMENLKFRCKLQQADYIRINGSRGTRTPSGKIEYWSGQCTLFVDPYLCDVYKIKNEVTVSDFMRGEKGKVYKLVSKENPEEVDYVKLYKEI